jgi:hypothetical protein
VRLPVKSIASVKRFFNRWSSQMAKIRALKDAAKDPLAAKDSWVNQNNPKASKRNPHLLTILGFFTLGLASGFFLRHILKIRL